MPDQQRPKAERDLQQIFRKSGLISGLMFVPLALVVHGTLSGLPDRVPAADSQVAVRYDPVRLDAESVAPLRLVGAWRITASEPRMGGISALAADSAGFTAISDSGVVIRLPKPGAAGAMASFHDLPDGPGSPLRKAGRDSEAMVADGRGRGWWIAFENAHAAWLFDRDFTRVIRKVDLRALGWPTNLGAEGAVWGRHGLLLFPEAGDEMVEVSDRGLRLKLRNRFGRLSETTSLADGRIAMIARSYSPLGFSSQLLMMGEELQPQLLARLDLGRLDNPEAMAAERLPDGGTRLWIMTDNDLRRRVPTMLIAVDVKP